MRVLGRDGRGGHRPGDLESGVVPADRTFMRRTVLLGELVVQLSGPVKDAKAVGEPFGDPKGKVVLLIQDLGDVPPERRG